jgi:DNA-binding transcriptional LysR family regulator
MIDRYHLRYFLAVIDTGNFSRAAAACNVSQPTLSVAIARLEKHLGHVLFHRTNRRVALTDAGARLAAYARRIEEEFAGAERAVSGSIPTKLCRIGILASIPSIWIEDFLRAHRRADKDERVEIVEGRERDLQDRLTRGRLDCALTLLRDGTDRTDHDMLFTEGYRLAMASGHALAGRAVIAAAELADEPMIVRRHCELLPETSRFFTASGVRPLFPARTINDDRALAYVRAGLGITMMPDCFRDPAIARPELQDFGFRRTIGLLYAPHADADALRSGGAIRGLIRTIEQAQAAIVRNRHQ